MAILPNTIIPSEPRHIGQTRYTAEQYIKVINSYEYKHKCIFKPINYMQMCLSKCREARLMYTAQLIYKLHPNMRLRRKKIAISQYMYVLNYGKDNPFSNADYKQRLVYDSRVHNYVLYKMLINNADHPDLEDMVQKYIKRKKVTVTGTTKAYLSLLGM